MRYFILRSKLAKKTANEGDLSELKAFLKNIGSNFILQGRKFEFLAEFEWALASRSDTFSNWLAYADSFRMFFYDYKSVGGSNFNQKVRLY